MDMDRVDMSLICRACKNVSSSMRSIFDTLNSGNISTRNPRIDEMLMACAAVQISFGDGLPSLICDMCIQTLKNAFSFKKQCESVDITLREYCKSMKVNAIKQELQNSDFIESLSNLLSNEDHLPKEPSAVIQAEPSTSLSDIKSQPPESDYIQFLENNQVLLTCRECSKVFTTLEGLRSHKRSHTGTLFKCKQCDKEYTRKNHLERHEASHGKRKVHVCKICNKTLTRMEHLKRHLVIHLREKPFNCKTCNRGFNRVEHLHNHVPRCKGENVHCCPVCNKAFNREDSLEVHKQQHDSIQLSLPTIENLDNIEQHYFEVDYDANLTFSDNSDVEDCFEPQVEVTESLESKLDMANDATSVAMQSITENTSIEDSALDKNEQLQNDTPTCIDISQDLEDTENDEKPLAELAALVKSEEKIEYQVQEDDDDNDHDTGNDNDNNDDARDSSVDSSDEEYLPKKVVQTPPNGKRRGRPRKYPPKPKVPGRRRGRPLGSATKKKIKDEDEEIGSYPCPICNEFYDRLSLLDKHAREAHPGLKVHKCNICGKEFNRPNHLKRHMTSHSDDKPHTCDICTKSFSRRDHLNQHQKFHESSGDHPCDICAKPFNKADQLAKHKAFKHGIGDKSAVMGEKKHYCDICQKGFTTEKYRDIHMKAHNGEKTFQCRVCEKTFFSKSHLTEHMKFHNEQSKKFLCSECGQRFIRNDYLVIHMRRHRGEKPFKCRFCGKGFPRTTDLTVHERYHTGEKTHLCTVCGRGFGRAYNLTVHMRTHTGEKPYQCTYCDAAFAQGNDLKAHIRRHTGERFQCDLCSESFLMGYLLTQHKRVVHGLNVVSNIRRLQPVNKTENPDEPPPITIPLPKPVIPENLMFNHLLPPIHKQEKIDEAMAPPAPVPPIAVPLSKPMVPDNFIQSINTLQAQLSFTQMHFSSSQRPAV
ncbi:uncharacterized protein LOC143202184 isoform X3 [Rhynchophorus ferrugineus]